MLNITRMPYDVIHLLCHCAVTRPRVAYGGTHYGTLCNWQVYDIILKPYLIYRRSFHLITGVGRFFSAYSRRQDHFLSDYLTPNSLPFQPVFTGADSHPRQTQLQGLHGLGASRRHDCLSRCMGGNGEGSCRCSGELLILILANLT